MSKDTTEVIARDVYEVGMTVRLRNGATWLLERNGNDREHPLVSSGGYLWEADGINWAGPDSDLCIIGEVVTAPKAVVATKAKRAAVTSTRTEERVYSDGIVTHNGKVDGMTMDEARKERRYIDRCIDRLKRDGEYYGWEV